MSKRRPPLDPLVPRVLLPAWSYPFVGLGAVLIGLAPWLRTGMHLPLQNLWATPTLPADMPLVLVPLNQYYLATILALFVTAGVIGGALARTAPAPHRGLSGGLTALGALLGSAVAVLQSARVLLGGLREDEVPEAGSADTYATLVIAWAALSALGGLLILVLLARAPRAGATVAVAVAAPAVGTWAIALVAPSVALASSSVQTAVGYLHWLPAVVVGLALAWCGVRTGGRIAAWVMSLVLLWVIPAVLTAITYVAGYRAATSLLESVGSGLDVLALALAPNLAGPPLLLALAIGVAGTFGLWLVNWLRGRALRSGNLAASEPGEPR